MSSDQDMPTATGCADCQLVCGTACSGVPAGPSADQRRVLVAAGAAGVLLASATMTVESARSVFLLAAVAMAALAGMGVAGLGMLSLRSGPAGATQWHRRAQRLLPLAVGGVLTVWSTALVGVMRALW